MADVTLKSVTKIFEKEVVAVAHLDLEIADKEFMVLVGPSGCGKSTILRMIAGLEEATEGEIRIDGKIVNTVPPKERDIAMVFQNYALYPHMTAYQNMAFGLKLRKYPKRAIEKRVHEAAEILRITQLLNRKPKALSGGERQRVAVGRAIVRKPKVFLFDEPLSNLDAKMRVQMRAELSKLHSQLEATIIYVTHDQVEAMTMGERIAVMKDGILQQLDKPLHLYDRPSNRFVAGFIGSPAMNFLEGTVDMIGDALHFGDGTIQLALPPQRKQTLSSYINEKIVMGIRPEDLSLPVSGGNKAEEAIIQVGVELVEPMGNETLLYLNTGSSPLVARVDGRAPTPEIGQRIRLVMNISRAHFFDPNTEIALC